MTHGIFLREHPNGLWRLISTSSSAEAALKDKKLSLEEAKKAGKVGAETAIRTFSTTWFIPSTATEIKEDLTQLYN